MDRPTVRRRLAAALLTLGVAVPGATAELDPQAGYTLVRNLMSEVKKDRRKAAEELIAAGDRSLVPAIVDAYFFTPRLYRNEMRDVLEALTGESYRSYHDWVEYVGRSEIEPKERYIEWKALMFRRSDPRYDEVFYAGAPTKIRLEEVVSGGVPLDGIPSLDDPPVMPGREARYLERDERVFGVVVGGEARAYPHRFLSWHEMLNDVVGGEPVTLSYCTLCGSGILYSARTAEGERRLLGTSGLLYRSNKLMFDHETYSLWSNITGEAVVGRQAGANARLEVLPVTVTTWGEWLERHPETLVLDLGGVKKSLAHLPYEFPYVPGAADRRRHGVEFPVWQKSDALERNAEVFAIEINGSPKAYPLERLIAAGVVNDEVGGIPIVLVTDPDSGAVRAYHAGEESFRRREGGGLVDEAGGAWTLTESALTSAESDRTLPRLPKGHIAYWFGWYGFYPQTEIWQGGGG